MSFVLQPWQLLMLALAGWINRQQQEVIEYLRTENQVLKEAYGKKRIRLNDDQRRRLAVKGKVLGRKVLGEIGTIVTPDTILCWHRQLVAQKWDYSHRRKNVGRPRVSQTIVELVIDAGDRCGSTTACLSRLAQPRGADRLATFSAKAFDRDPREKGGCPGLEETPLAAVRMFERDRFRMQRQAPRAGPFPTVFLVADDGQVVVGEMHADLVLATCNQVDVQ
jgi:hypothetical protein